jgi:nucleotide-binding universal stress UspA family protein
MYKSILLPVDLDQESSWNKTVPAALNIAQASGANIHVFMAIPDYGMSVVGSFFPPDHSEKMLAEVNAALETFVSDHFPAGAKVEYHARHGTIYKEILAAADNLGCDLIVMASHRPDTKDYLLGPNAARVVRHAKQAVFVVRE